MVTARNVLEANSSRIIRIPREPPAETVAPQAFLTKLYKLFRRKGYSRVSIDEIAAATPITKRSLYYHFKSKDELLACMLQTQAGLALIAFMTFGDRLSGSPPSSMLFSRTWQSGLLSPAGPDQALLALSWNWPTCPGTPHA